ncbi:hypothetical protein MCOR02_012069 [Pyricularia oryzae]|nr:hypothetical protein MCOR02_012069 [Pyricularia oryzae]
MYPMPSAPAPVISIRFNAAKLPVSSSFAVSGDPDKVQNHSNAGAAPAAIQSADANSCAGGFNYAEKHKQTSAVELPPSPESSRPPAENAHHRTQLWRVGNMITSDRQEAEQYQRRGWIVLKVHSESKRDDDVEGGMGYGGGTGARAI